MRWPNSFDPSALWTREFQVDFRPLARLVRERPEDVVLCVGVALRIVTYLWNRPMWLDEASLRGNVVDVPILAFSEPLWNDQLAPMGFLIVVRTLAAVLGERNYVLRSVPLMSGLAALFLFHRLAPRVLPRRPALVALVLFAFSDDLIYYASEFKPYSLDLAFGLAITLLSVEAIRRPPTVRLVAWMGILLAVAPWFTFPSSFVIAGCGAVLLWDSLRSGRLRTAMLWLSMGLGWLAIFAIAYRASHALLSPYTTMYRFWDFAFLPLGWPPSRDGLLRSAGLLLEVFVNPLTLLTTGTSPLGVILPISLLAVGAFSLARRSPALFVVLVGPIALALGASVARRYPFHGRLLLELSPALFLTIAEGTEWVARSFPGRSGMAYRTVLVALLAFPCWDACYNGASRRDRDFNIHGDLHPNVFIDDRPDRWIRTWLGERPSRVGGGIFPAGRVREREGRQ